MRSRAGELLVAVMFYTLGMLGCGPNSEEVSSATADDGLLVHKAALCSWARVPVPRTNFVLQQLDATYPRGDVNLGGVPFSIPSAGNNTWHAHLAAGGGSSQVSLDIPTHVAGANEVHTLINTYWGQAGSPYAFLEFWGSRGTYYKHPLYGNDDIRDYNRYRWTENINGTTTTNVFLNASGNHRLDKQRIILPPSFASQVLTGIRLTDTGRPEFQRTFLAGVTVEFSCQ